MASWQPTSCCQSLVGCPAVTTPPPMPQCKLHLLDMLCRCTPVYSYPVVLYLPCHITPSHHPLASPPTTAITPTITPASTPAITTAPLPFPPPLFHPSSRIGGNLNLRWNKTYLRWGVTEGGVTCLCDSACAMACCLTHTVGATTVVDPYDPYMHTVLTPCQTTLLTPVSAPKATFLGCP